ncbi:chromate efflux transporter [uncultured Roseibium sp.]|uniref:chromate efflux transporter n=1 Tax=uncultured Roseibium sp. TaxID=1936171 RepID=UPI00260DEA61|nr:chromate efflux transporter [uncultured Roseibium sp.]
MSSQPTFTGKPVDGARLPQSGDASWQRLFSVFGGIGLLSFGGPAAQIALMHRKLVDETGWLSEKTYVNALGFCMLLPGPEAMQLATYCGWKLRGIAGGLLAGLLFVIPGALAIFGLAFVYTAYGHQPTISQLFLGIKAAVLIVVVEALLRLSKRALTERRQWVVAVLAFSAIFFLSPPFPMIVLAAALYGAAFMDATVQAAPEKQVPIRTSFTRTLGVVTVGLGLWLGPLAAVAWASGAPILGDLGWFFSKLAVVTFGGAYAVLAYMAQDVVALHGWLEAGEMMDGLGLAETTPGPLILVTQFVGYVAAYHEGGIALGFAGGAVALWATFVPCFLWIFAGAPYIDWISSQPRLKSALSAIIAAVVGVVLNLSLWFALHVLFETVTHRHLGWLTLWVPDVSSLDWRVPVLAALCALLLLRLHVNLIWTLLLAAVGGLLLSLVA